MNIGALLFKEIKFQNISYAITFNIIKALLNKEPFVRAKLNIFQFKAYIYFETCCDTPR